MCALTDEKVEDIGCLKEHGIAHEALEKVKEATESGVQPEDAVELEQEDEEEEEVNEIVVHEDDGDD